MRGTIVTRFCSGSDGNYRISLPAGKYVIAEVPHGGPLITTGEPVEVRADGYTSHDLFYDNGMR